MSSESVGDQRLERRPKLSERVVALLRDQILAGRIRPATSCRQKAR